MSSNVVGVGIPPLCGKGSAVGAGPDPTSPTGHPLDVALHELPVRISLPGETRRSRPSDEGKRLADASTRFCGFSRLCGPSRGMRNLDRNRLGREERSDFYAAREGLTASPAVAETAEE